MGEVHPFPHKKKWAFPDCWHFSLCVFLVQPLGSSLLKINVWMVGYFKKSFPCKLIVSLIFFQQRFFHLKCLITRIPPFTIFTGGIFQVKKNSPADSSFFRKNIHQLHSWFGLLVVLGFKSGDTLYIDVSKNSGTPKSSILIGFSLIINHPFWGTFIFWKHPYI